MDKSNNITTSTCFFLIQLHPENKRTLRIHRKEIYIYKATKGETGTRHCEHGLMAAVRRPSARSIPCLSSGRTLTTRVRLVANQRVKQHQPKRSSTHPTPPPRLLPDERRGIFTRELARLVTSRLEADVIACSTSQPPTPSAGGNPWRHKCSIRREFLYQRRAPFDVKFLVKWIMDFVEAKIIVSLGTISYTCLDDEGKGLGRLLGLNGFFSYRGWFKNVWLFLLEESMNFSFFRHFSVLLNKELFDRCVEKFLIFGWFSELFLQIG